METAFTDLVGCRHPLQQAAVGGVSVPELAGAVAGAGALGMLCEFGLEAAADRMTRALDLTARAESALSAHVSKQLSFAVSSAGCDRRARSRLFCTPIRA